MVVVMLMMMMMLVVVVVIPITPYLFLSNRILSATE
jgi:hypothetical protein